MRKRRKRPLRPVALQFVSSSTLKKYLIAIEEQMDNGGPNIIGKPRHSINTRKSRTSSGRNKSYKFSIQKSDVTGKLTETNITAPTISYSAFKKLLKEQPHFVGVETFARKLVKLHQRPRITGINIGKDRYVISRKPTDDWGPDKYDIPDLIPGVVVKED